jgi:signal transduction histidine kinase
LYIEVSDSGVGLIGKEAGGTGLANVRERLATLFGKEGKLVLENRAGGGVRAKMELPL